MKDIEGLMVGDAMTRGVICVDVEDTVRKAAEVMKKNDISGVVVTKKGDGVGVVTERDIICKIVAEGRRPDDITVRQIMTSPLITIQPDADIDDAARLMRDKDVRRLVVSEKGRIIGVISEFDIVKIEPALHTIIKETYNWQIHQAHAAAEGYVAGVCESCENYSEKLTNYDGRMICAECRTQ